MAAEDRWHTYAMPILEYLHEHRNPRLMMGVGVIADGTGLDPEEITVESESLYRDGYILGSVRRMYGDWRQSYLEDTTLTGDGLRAVGAWPSGDPYDALVELLELLIAQTDDQEKKSKLRAFRDSLGDVGKGTIVALLTQLLSSLPVPHVK